MVALLSPQPLIPSFSSQFFFFDLLSNPLFYSYCRGWNHLKTFLSLGMTSYLILSNPFSRLIWGRWFHHTHMDSYLSTGPHCTWFSLCLEDSLIQYQDIQGPAWSGLYPSSSLTCHHFHIHTWVLSSSKLFAGQSQHWNNELELTEWEYLKVRITACLTFLTLVRIPPDCNQTSVHSDGCWSRHTVEHSNRVLIVLDESMEEESLKVGIWRNKSTINIIV